MSKKTAEGHLLKDSLSNYDEDKYNKPSVTVDVIICTIKDNNLKVLLIKRKYPPFRNCWAIPGGFVQIEKEESLLKTAERELQEETGLKDIYIEQLRTYGDPKRDPRMRIITVAYFALLPYNRIPSVRAADDAKEAEWFILKDIVNGKIEVAFDHRNILRDCLIRLQGRIVYSSIAFELVSETFTWAQLQKIYEIVLDKKILTPNFRRGIKNRYIINELKSKTKPRIGRPSSLLSYSGDKPLL